MQVVSRHVGGTNPSPERAAGIAPPVGAQQGEAEAPLVVQPVQQLQGRGGVCLWGRVGALHPSRKPWHHQRKGSPVMVWHSLVGRTHLDLLLDLCVVDIKVVGKGRGEDDVEPDPDVDGGDVREAGVPVDM